MLSNLTNKIAKLEESRTKYNCSRFDLVSTLTPMISTWNELKLGASVDIDDDSTFKFTDKYLQINSEYQFADADVIESGVNICKLPVKYIENYEWYKHNTDNILKLYRLNREYNKLKHNITNYPTSPNKIKNITGEPTEWKEELGLITRKITLWKQIGTVPNELYIEHKKLHSMIKDFYTTRDIRANNISERLNRDYKKKLTLILAPLREDIRDLQEYLGDFHMGELA